MIKALSLVKLNATLTLSECKDGFWLYDETQKMNLAIRVKTEREAFIEAIEYYQTYLKEYKDKYFTLSGQIKNFLDQVKDIDD